MINVTIGKQEMNKKARLSRSIRACCEKHTFFVLRTPPSRGFCHYQCCIGAAALLRGTLLPLPGASRRLQRTTWMAGGSEAIVEAKGSATGGAIKTVLVVIAMEAEAVPLVQSLKLNEDNEPSIYPNGVPWKKFSGVHDGLNVHIVVPGKDLRLGVDSVGTVPASLLTYASATALHPDLIVNAGTAGGFQAKGAAIGDVYIATEYAHHDRRIPIPVFDKYGIGNITASPTGNLVKHFNLKEGKLSTGNSLDMCPEDEKIIKANDATIKDMEGASVAYVADLLQIPVIAMKAVTDIVDGNKPTIEEFLENLTTAATALAKSVPLVLKYVTGKYITDLERSID